LGNGPTLGGALRHTCPRLRRDGADTSLASDEGSDLIAQVTPNKLIIFKEGIQGVFLLFLRQTQVKSHTLLKLLNSVFPFDFAIQGFKMVSSI